MYVLVAITFNADAEVSPVPGDPLAIDMSFEANQAVQNAHWEVCRASLRLEERKA